MIQGNKEKDDTKGTLKLFRKEICKTQRPTGQREGVGQSHGNSLRTVNHYLVPPGIQGMVRKGFGAQEEHSGKGG